MSRRRARASGERKRATAAAARHPTTDATPKRPVPVVAATAAVLLALACVVPLMLWGNPYPEGVVPYWLWGTAVAAGVEADSTLPRAMKPAAIARATAPFVASERAMLLADRTTPVSSPASITPERRAELAEDARLPTAPFGPALPLEPIDSSGRVDGDVVYVADLGERNNVLRERFGDRTWYRLAIRQENGGSFGAELVPY